MRVHVSIRLCCVSVTLRRTRLSCKYCISGGPLTICLSLLRDTLLNSSQKFAHHQRKFTSSYFKPWMENFTSFQSATESILKDNRLRNEILHSVSSRRYHGAKRYPFNDHQLIIITPMELPRNLILVHAASIPLHIPWKGKFHNVRITLANPATKEHLERQA